MGIATTTPKAIRETLVTTIHAISPTFAEYGDLGWRYIPDDDPTGTELRRFTILNEPSTETFGGIHGGDGIGYDYTCIVRASYGGLSSRDVDDIVDEDARDLWLAIHPLPDTGGIDGMLPFRDPMSVEFFNDEPGAVVVDFVFQIYYKGRDR